MPATSTSAGATTVLVVAYRHADFVVECLDSIRAQSVPPERVIIADDCSGDSTPDVIADYLDRHPGFGELHRNEKNLSLNRTLNLHLATVRTPFFTYISADDLMAPQRIERHLALLAEAQDAILAYSDAEVIDRDSRRVAESSKDEFPWPNSPAVRERPFAELIHRNWIPAASLFFRTPALQAAGGYREDLFYEDFELLVRLSQAHPFAWTDEKLVAVRRLETSLGATGFAAASPRFLTALDAALQHYSDAEPELRALALSRRWELAKRASRSPMDARTSGRMLWSARGGASSRPALARHLLAWAACSAKGRVRRPRTSIPGTP